MKRSGRQQTTLARVAAIVTASLVAVVLLLVALGTLLPRNWQVQRSVLINAPAPSIHRITADLKRWSEWAQWNRAELAPNNRIEGSSTGEGATLVWSAARGDEETASGVLRITREDERHGVWLTSDTGGPEPGVVRITYAAKAGATEVTWTDEGKLPPLLGGLFLDLFQQRLGRHMDQGLERLKELAESTSPGQPTPPQTSAE